jgi:hypothetical protein
VNDLTTPLVLAPKKRQLLIEIRPLRSSRRRSVCRRQPIRRRVDGRGAGGSAHR